MNTLDDSLIQTFIDNVPGDIALYEVTEGALLPIWVAESLAEFSGMTLEEYDGAIAEDAMALVAEVDRDAVVARLSEMIAKQKDDELTYRVFNKDEGLIWIHAHGRIIGKRNGNPVLVVSYSRTSTETAALSELLDIAAAICYVIDRRTHEMLFASSAALKMWGHGDYSGYKCYNYVNGFDAPCPWCSLPLMKDGFHHSDATYLPVANMWLSLDCRAIDWHGREAIVVIAHDITEHEKQQRNIEEDKKTLETMLGRIPGGVALFSVEDGRVRLEYTNTSFYDVHHGTPEYWASISDNPANWIIEEDRTLFWKELRDVIDSGKPQGDATYRIIDEKGITHWVNNRFRAAFEHDGTRFYYGSFTDLDGQKAVEAAIEEASRMYEQAVDEAKLVVYEYDIPHKRIIMSDSNYTESYMRLMSIPRVIENAPDSLIPIIDPDTLDGFLEMYRKIREGAPSAECEVWIKQHEIGEPRCEHMSFTTVFDADGTPIKAFGMSRNITSQKAAERRYRDAFDRVRSAYPYNLGSFHLNLTRNWCGDGISPFDHVLKEQESGTVDGYLEEFSKLIADESIKQHFLEVFERKKLIQAYHSGKRELTIEYPVVYRDGTRHWNEGAIHMVSNPDTGDLEAITYAIDNDARKRSERIIEILTSNDLDYAGIIHPAEYTIELLSRGMLDLALPTGVPVDYEKASTIALAANVPEEERSELHNSTKMETLLHALDLEGDYSASFSCYENGEKRRKQLWYRWLDDAGGDILITQRDITSAWNREQERMRQQALLDVYEHDRVTGLLSREAALMRARRNLKPSDCFTMIVILIDNLRDIRGSYGHTASDTVMCEAAQRLAMYCETADEPRQVAQFDSGEFLVYLGNRRITSVESDAELRTLVELTREPILIDTEDVDGVSKEAIQLHNCIGVAASDGETDPEQVARNASLAANTAFQGSTNHVRIYSGSISESVERRKEIIRILTHAIENNSFYMVYQPKVDMEGNCVTGFEALARIEHSGVLPSEFIPIAEESGFIRQIGRVATKLAIQQLAAWRDEGKKLMPVSINYSSAQMGDIGYLDYLIGLLEKFNIPPSLLEVEITESLLLQPGKTAQQLFNRMREAGIHILMDDFGKGYSSLSYLAYVPVDIIKLDMSLVNAFLTRDGSVTSNGKGDGNAFIRDIIKLAHDLGKIIVVEGVEEKWQVDLLRAYNCDAIQGFYYSKPLPADQAARYFDFA